MIEKTVKIGDREVRFRASASIPRLYRARFKRDIFADLSKMEKDAAASADNIEIFENLAYIMALHADPSIPDNIDDWLLQFDMFDIYNSLPDILELWGRNLYSESEIKKNASEQTVK